MIASVEQVGIASVQVRRAGYPQAYNKGWRGLCPAPISLMDWYCVQMCCFGVPAINVPHSELARVSHGQTARRATGKAKSYAVGPPDE